MKCALSFFLLSIFWQPSEEQALNSLQKLPWPFSIFKSSYHFYHDNKQTNKGKKKFNQKGGEKKRKKKEAVLHLGQKLNFPFVLQQQLLNTEQQSCISAGKNDREKPVAG